MTENPSGTCVRCHESVEGSNYEWYCSNKCKQKNESPGKAHEYLTDEQREACEHW